MPLLIRIEQEKVCDVILDVVKVYDGAPRTEDLLFCESIDEDLVSQLEAAAACARVVLEAKKTTREVAR